MDLNDVEKIDLNALGGADTVTVNDLTGTDVTEVNVNLAGTIGGTAGDAQADTVIVNGTNGNDIIDVFGAGQFDRGARPGGARQRHRDGRRERLARHQRPRRRRRHHRHDAAGRRHEAHPRRRRRQRHHPRQPGRRHDPRRRRQRLRRSATTATTSPCSAPATTSSSGTRATATTRSKARTASTRMLFFGSNASENIDIVANGGRALFLRDVADVTMDMNDVERIEFRGLGGADNIVVGDLSGTDVTDIELDLRGPNGRRRRRGRHRHGQRHAGRRRVRRVRRRRRGHRVRPARRGATSSMPRSPTTGSSLNGLGGDDVIDATSLEADGIQLTMNGGLGDDIFLGSEGDDLINGGDGNDTASDGRRRRHLRLEPRRRQRHRSRARPASTRCCFNGANVAENIDISANGGRVALLPRHRQRRHGPQRRRGRSTSTPSAAPTRSPSTTCRAPT